MAEVKRCTACKQVKPVSEFHKRTKSPDGLRPRCKECRLAESVANYAKNADRIKAQALQWQKDNPEAAAAKAARYRASEKAAATRREWAERTDKRAKDRAYYRATADVQKARARARQALVRGAQVEKFRHDEVFERDGWICQLCDEPVDRSVRFPHALSASLDHVLPLSLGGPHTKANTQTTHLVCNMRKGARVA